MHHQKLVRGDVDYAAYLARVRCHTLEEAVRVSGLPTATLRVRMPALAGEKWSGLTQPTRPSNYFVFYQAGGRWNWRRKNDSATVVDGSRASFGCYARCVADAREHGWEGKPVSLFLAACRT